MQLMFNLLDGGTIESTRKGVLPRGCDGCPLDSPKRHKFLGFEHLNKSAVLWLNSPSKQDNLKKRPLAGTTGEFLAEEFAAAGLSLKDFAKEYVVRCRATKQTDEGTQDREPNEKERYHCSLHTDRAVDYLRSSAPLWLTLGKGATAALYPKFQKSKTAVAPVFWDEKRKLRVVPLDHPTYLRQETNNDWRLKEFRERLATVAFFKEHPGQFGIFDAMDFGGIRTLAELKELWKLLRTCGERVMLDIEAGMVNGKHKILCLGFSWKAGVARSVLLEHPENLNNPELPEMKRMVKRMLKDRRIEKGFHYGSSDYVAIQKMWKVKVARYTGDSFYGSFLKRTFHRQHGLVGLAQTFYTKYAGYKDYIKPHLAKSPTKNYADIPARILLKYNCADCSLSKEIDEDISQSVPPALLQVYTWTGITLEKMQGRGPKFDYKYYNDVVKDAVIKRLHIVTNKLRLLVNDPKVNLNTPANIKTIVFDYFKLPDPGGKGSTKSDNLQLSYQEKPHPFVKYLLEYRELEKMRSTYMVGYIASADKHDGELRTRWHLAGAITGRLRSGGKKEGGEAGERHAHQSGIVNLQNIHGNPLLQNLLISSPRWPAIIKFLRDNANVPDVRRRFLLEFGDEEVFLAFDYSQIEIRILAEVAQDELLLSQFQQAANAKDPSDPRSDIHCLVGNLLNPKWSLEFIKSSKDIRTFIKGCHFGMVYGLDDRGLYFTVKAKGIKTTQKKVTAFHRAYFAKYKGVARWIAATRKFVEENHYVDTLFGFRRLIGAGADPTRTTKAENQACNSPIQSAAHQLMLNVMALLHLKAKKYALLQQPVMEVHDALIWRVKLRDLPQAYQEGKQLLEKEVIDFTERVLGYRVKVPLLSEASAGFRYGAMGDYEGQDVLEFAKNWAGTNAKSEAKVAEWLAKAA